MPTRRRSAHDVDVAGVDVDCPSMEISRLRRARRDDVVHPVEAAEEGRLPASGRADQRRTCGVLRDRELIRRAAPGRHRRRSRRLRVSIRMTPPPTSGDLFVSASLPRRWSFPLHRRRPEPRRRARPGWSPHLPCMRSSRRVTVRASTEKRKPGRRGRACSRPRLAMEVVVRRDRVREDLHRERRGRLVEARAPELVVERGEEKAPSRPRSSPRRRGSRSGFPESGGHDDGERHALRARGAERRVLPSRRLPGTRLISSSVVRAMIGTIMIASATRRRSPRSGASESRPDRRRRSPTTIDGMPFRTSRREADGPTSGGALVLGEDQPASIPGRGHREARGDGISRSSR